MYYGKHITSFGVNCHYVFVNTTWTMTLNWQILFKNNHSIINVSRKYGVWFISRNIWYSKYYETDKNRRLDLQISNFAFLQPTKFFFFCKTQVNFVLNHFILTPYYWQVIKNDCKMIAFFHLSESCFWRMSYTRF